MKNNYYTINPLILSAESMRKLVNPIFQKEIALDILRGKPPDYSNLTISNINFSFKDAFRYFTHQGNKIRYIYLSLELHKAKHAVRCRSLKIIDYEINTTYLRRAFDQLKALMEEDKERVIAQKQEAEERNKKLDEIREKNNIKYPKVSLYTYKQNIFSLTFNSITEDEIDQIMTYYNKINKSGG